MSSFNYNRKHPIEWGLPDTKYHKTIAVIRDYENVKEEYESIMDLSSVSMDGMPHGSTVGDPTASRAIKAEKLHDEIKAVEDALQMIPPEYRDGIMNWLVKRIPYPMDADRSTYGRWKQYFVYNVAINLYII